MQIIADRPEAPSAIRSDLGAIFISLEHSRSTWLITSLSPGGGKKMSKHSVPAGNICVLLAHFSELRQKAFARTGKSFRTHDQTQCRKITLDQRTPSRHDNASLPE
jgi:transposase